MSFQVMKKSGNRHAGTGLSLVCMFLSTLFFFSFLEEAYAKKRSFIVGFHRKPGTHERSLMHRSGGRIRRSYNKLRVLSVTLDDAEIERIRKDSAVAYIEEDAVISAVEPDLGQEYTDSWGVNHIGAGDAHSSGNRGEGVKIAVLDTGIDYLHDDLRDNYRGGYDFVHEDSDPYDDSWNSHGTHIAGIIAAQTNNMGVVGVAPGADIYAVKVLDGGGFGLLSWLIAGIEWSVENGIDIINMSIQGQDFRSLRDACDSAYAAGVLIVAAAGNTYGGAVQYPAAYDSVIAVTGTDQSDLQAYFSPAGPEVELAAPGVDILSSIADRDYDTLSGTSQAAAHAAGTAALFYASGVEDMNGDLLIDHVDVRYTLQATAADLGLEGPDEVYGYGRVDASAAALNVFEPVVLELVRTPNPPRHDMEKVFLSEGVYEVTVENDGLRGMKMAVYKEGRFKRKRSRLFRFHRRGRGSFFRRHYRGERTIILDAPGTGLEIYFTPYGRPGGSAELTITYKSVDAEGAECKR